MTGKRRGAKVIAMARYDETNAKVTVDTFKEGLAAAVAHDLKIEVRKFTIEVDWAAQTVVATFDPRSLSVVGVVEGHTVRPDVLSAKDRATIERHIVDDVFEVKPDEPIRFESKTVTPSDKSCKVHGTLTVKDVSKPVELYAYLAEGRWVCEYTLSQPAFGIKPFRALFGTLKIKPDVHVVVSLPAP